MSIVLARIDNRLIHGQVLESWVPHVNADCIVVANDQAAGNAFQKLLMEAAVPRGIRVIIDTLEGVAELCSTGELIDRKVLLLLASSQDALAIHRRGVGCGKLNLGNMHGGQGKQRVACTIALDPDDVDNLRLLEADGVRVVSQCIPSDREQDWKKLIQILGA
ncbi:PTS system mannose/fructose/N-acetylgalactosamine-transporter subunit IIB [Trichloromonas sp.]|uniref:PTS system mannose/fructose/N-acetylgalactosamine-transporter subunit IIB n=1 Tax=Trichloromonas sp. TaxID=3069249 RepID=UPI003D81762C